MIPELLTGQEICQQADRWGVDPRVLTLATVAALRFERQTGRSVRIISGFRSESEQADLRKRGRPTAPDDLSTHRTCPATGIDVSLGALPSRVLKATWGLIVTEVGLRWGGGSKVDSGGIPTDWAHLDSGPRQPITFS